MKLPTPAIIALVFFSQFFVMPLTMSPVFADSSKEEVTRTVGSSGLPLPRFVSFRSGQVNVRAGPGIRYPISWIYHRRGLPVEIIDEFDTWRQIKDWQGTQGWVHQSMLKGQRSVMITGALRTLYDDPDSNSRPIAQVEAGVIGELESCNSDDWCQVEIKDISGWIERSSFYGAYAEEVFD
ncbi:SH3 domain-containing protein [Kiloniella laminariae]|uniref:SH3 domain-containing protein n=1 Tax=Kiloniella laminariae TaxID=454162 RepID=UPI00037B6BC7|nr:SH3 domain-containing protein [Kiloniella laminariae]